MRDIFICHAREDKEAVVRPLSRALQERRISCWLDEAEILWGDSIVQKVNEGLASSRFVLVVLSTSFLNKNWPQHELNTALNDEASSGEVKVLPLIVGNDSEKKNILTQLPIIRGKLHLVWDGFPDRVVSELHKRLLKTETSDQSNFRQDPPATTKQTVRLPKLKKQFTDRDKDTFLTQSFDTIRSYFREALLELESHYPEVKTDLTDIHNQKFTCKIYLHGTTKCQSKVWIGGLMASNSIAYSEGFSDVSSDNSYNDIISVDDNGSELSLSFTLGHHGNPNSSRLNPSEAAEELWRRFTLPLTR